MKSKTTNSMPSGAVHVFIVQLPLLALLIMLGLAVTAGCATKSTKEEHLSKAEETSISYKSNGLVKAEVVAALEGSRYPILPGVTYTNPEPVPQNPIPSYPSRLLSRQLDPVEVIARAIVNTDGTVAFTSIIFSSSSEKEFSAEVLAAVKKWTFSPLTRVEGSKVDALPFTQEYRFTFRQVDGRAIVTSGARQ